MNQNTANDRIIPFPQDIDIRQAHDDLREAEARAAKARSDFAKLQVETSRREVNAEVARRLELFTQLSDSAAAYADAAVAQEEAASAQKDASEAQSQAAEKGGAAAEQQAAAADAQANAANAQAEAAVHQQRAAWAQAEAAEHQHRALEVQTKVLSEGLQIVRALVPHLDAVRYAVERQASATNELARVAGEQRTSMARQVLALYLLAVPLSIGALATAASVLMPFLR
jgi:hypothetical protein